MKKKIGISFTRTNFQHYWNWFSKTDLGDDLELVLLSFKEPDQQALEQCDAYVLTGGVDIDPVFYQAFKPLTKIECEEIGMEIIRLLKEEKYWDSAWKIGEDLF